MTEVNFLTVAQEFAASKGMEGVEYCAKGAFKETYRAHLKSGQVVALKIVDRDKADSIRTSREIKALQRCKSSRIAKFIERNEFAASDGRIFDIVVEEYLDGGSLSDVIEKRELSVEEIREIVKGLTLALKDLLPLHLVHRDIKPANIMFRKGEDMPILVDFGIVRDLRDTSVTLSWLPHGPGTPFYAPPEQLNNEKYLIDWRSDQFAIGVLAAAAVTGKHPYQMSGMSPMEAVNSVAARKRIDPEFVAKMNVLGLSFVNRMILPWPSQRHSHPDSLLEHLY